MREPKINEQITAERVRLIDLKGKQLGIINFVDALARAQRSNVDLVQVSEDSVPPVCKLLDYKKYIFDKKKKRSLSKRKHKRTVLKEVKFRPATEEGDYQVKLKNLSRFLEQGDRAKITIRFRGREVIYKDQGYEVLNRIVGDLAGIAEPEQESKLEGKQLMTVLRPIPKQQLNKQQASERTDNKKEIDKREINKKEIKDYKKVVKKENAKNKDQSRGGKTL